MNKEIIFEKLDDSTKNHSIRVAELTRKIAIELQLSNLDEIYEIAKFHDIGKLKIDKDILFKTDRLISEEFEIIKQHPNFGVEIMKQYFSEQNLNCILCHHENIDGTGYYNKTDCEIPLVSKIIRIVDVYDALVSSRCYKDAYSKEDALFIMHRNVGKFFDRKIYSILLKLIIEND